MTGPMNMSKAIYGASCIMFADALRASVGWSNNIPAWVCWVLFAVTFSFSVYADFREGGGRL